MSFPTTALLVGITGGALFYFVFGFQGLVAASIGLLSFFGLGGWNYSRLIIKTLPRDLWSISIIIKLLRLLSHCKKTQTTLTDVFVKTAARFPNKTAIICVNDGRKWTFRELNEYSNRVANHFRGLGLKKGDVVALFVENSPEFMGLWMGLAKVGVVSALINFNIRHDGLAHCIRVSKPKAIVFSASLSDALGAVLPDLDPTLLDACLSVCGGSTLPQAKCLDVELENALSTEPPPLTDKATDDLTCYIYSSGTTGLPKACRMTGERVFTVAWVFGKLYSVREDDTLYNTLPQYHTSGGVIASGQMLVLGCTMVLRSKFSASNFWTDCIKHKCTVMFHIGEICRYLLAQPKRPSDTQHSIRLAIGNGLRPKIWEAFQKRFEVTQIGEFYGATEGNVGLFNPFGKVGSVGAVSLIFPSPVCLIKVDPETGEYIRNSKGFCIKTGIDEPGEVVGEIDEKISIRRFAGYEDKTATQKKVMRNVFKPGDAYFLSGDILRMDSEGFMYFCDRIGDTYRWKGENVSTMEIESTIASILEQRDVIVYGVEVPGAEGRAGMAAIVGNDQTVDLAHLSQQLVDLLPKYAIPVFIRLIEQPDLTGTFKLQKTRLKHEGFNLEHISDDIYMLDLSQKVYVPFTQDLYQQLANGAIQL